ncbi:hypothetical protein [Rhodococcus wratislaviensis]|uniref:Uncharacterized protein n=1 Tax=Rhodococcus wratislaviensis NBRC 100605 TaxID=1219028 RepID=X0PXZ9_RHOWR|nr:hypothetical protein [Rhodococcus wratislaviensis]GAF43262.1 hypothetical protein RW1_006_01590 [Rhodococcus wratislaviensis NBRC 100605]
MMTRLQVAIAVIVGYWLGRSRHTKPGMMLAAASAGRLAGSPQEMVDHATMLLQSSPEFAALDESVRGQLLDAVRVAALSTETAGIDIDKDRRVAGGADEAVQIAHETVEDTACLTGDGVAVDTVGPVVDGTETTATEVGTGALGVTGALTRRRRATRARAPAADTSEHADLADSGNDVDAEKDTTAALSDEAPTDNAAAAATPPTAEVRAWAAPTASPCLSDRGRLRVEVWEAYAAAHPGALTSGGTAPA